MHWAFWRPRDPEPFLPAYVQPGRSRWFSSRPSTHHAHHQHHRAPPTARGVQTGYYYTYPPPGHSRSQDYASAYAQPYPQGYSYGGNGYRQQVQVTGRSKKGKKSKVRFGGPVTVRVVR